jgi:hypothetical protein
VTHNTGGILVFDLLNLPQSGGHNIRISENIVMDNMTPNFAPQGKIVASVPTGTGIMVIANCNLQITDNVIGDNGTANVIIITYRLKFADIKYNPVPTQISI